MTRKESLIKALGYNVSILKKLTEDLERLKVEVESKDANTYDYIHFSGKYDRSNIKNQIKVVKPALLDLLDKIYFR